MGKLDLRKNTIEYILLGVVIFGLGIGAGFLLDTDRVSPAVPVREDSSGYYFINPLLFTDNAGEDDFPEYVPLKKSIDEYQQKAIVDKKATDISVYFRKMNHGEWISVNPDETFSPASMLKVVTNISVLRAAESDPSLLSHAVTIHGNDASLLQSMTRYPPKDPIRSGYTYTVRELVEHSLIESDNVADIALENFLGEEKISKTYDDLRVPKITAGTAQGYTAEQYSHLFRALYNGTYLSRSLSEQILQLLSTADFKQGIVAGVPEGTIVSHKFGVKTSPGSNELHDCGIVYFPNYPYFICVMTRGEDFEPLEHVIQDISAISWEYVKKIKS